MQQITDISETDLEKKVIYWLFFLLANAGAVSALWDASESLATVAECLGGRTAVFAQITVYIAVATASVGAGIIWSWTVRNWRPWQPAHPMMFRHDGYSIEQILATFLREFRVYWKGWGAIQRLLFSATAFLVPYFIGSYIYVVNCLEFCGRQPKNVTTISSAALTALSGALLWWFFGKAHHRVLGATS